MYPALVLTDPAGDAVLAPIALAADGRNEAWLRDFLLAHPAAVPAGAIDPAYGDLVPICKELRTPAGNLDCLFATRYGGLVIVECKLWRNPQARREVVGQVLDYAKELAGWGYGDLQREVAVARREHGGDPLFRLMAANFPDLDQARFVDAVSRNLERGRLMLLVAGDGIRQGTESIVRFVDRHAGLQLTFGLVEMAGYMLPDGRLLVQPRLLARTTNIERAVVRVEGADANLATVMPTTEGEAIADDDASVGIKIGPGGTFNPAVKEADRRWRAAFTQRVTFDDPEQDVGSSGYGRVYLPLPVPWARMTAYTMRSKNRCGIFLTLQGEAGEAALEELRLEAGAIERELAAATAGALSWERAGDLWRVVLSRGFPGVWSEEQDETQLAWLLPACNAFVNVLRPRVLRIQKMRDRG